MVPHLHIAVNTLRQEFPARFVFSVYRNSEESKRKKEVHQ
jgi:hypothetical protein